MGRVGRNLSVVLLVAVMWLASSAVSTLAASGASTGSSPGDRLDSIPTVTYTVDGLSGPAEILIDPWGVPHMYASTHYDAFFVQGFNAARDRLFQIDLWRRRGLGQLSEVFGPNFVAQDRAARLFLYRGDMYSEWLAYGSDAKRITTAFVEGINAYVQLTRDHPDLLPWEFRFLDYEPAFWEPEDVVRIRSHGLVRNVASEVQRARFIAQFGPEYDNIRRQLEPPWEVQIPEGLDLDSIPADVLDVYQLAKAGVRLEPDLLSAATSPEEAVELLLASTRDVFDTEGVGSNNWAIAPSLTASGRPILANDPHRAQEVPSLRYIAHLVAPGLNVIGAGEPGLPGISIGHNERIAFGLTIFAIDQEDLYVYRTNPDNPDEYMYQGRWEPMDVVTEMIAVRGAEPQAVEMKFTRHGPVIYEDPDENTAFAVRAAWLEPGGAPYFGSVEYMRAQNWDDFVAAMNRWGAPSENQVYADVDGNIGWTPRGRTPIRPNWDGLLPVPGDGRYEWAGYYDQDLLPVEHNPERGWVSTANEMNLPADYPYTERKLGFEWSLGWRQERIAEVLSESSDVTLRDMLRLQTDHVSIPGRRIRDAIATLSHSDPSIAKGLAVLQGWDAVMEKDSAGAALFHVWSNQRRLGRALLDQLVEPDLAEAIGSPHEHVLVDMMENPENYFGGEAREKRDTAIFESLAAAVRVLEERFGPDPADWRYGPFNQIHMRHALSSLVDADTRARIDVGPAEQSVVSNTVGASGASWRMILDVGNWDNSLAMSNPGQSGDPDSPHYRDLFPRWLQDGAFPLLYSRELIEAVAGQRIVLEPAR